MSQPAFSPLDGLRCPPFGFGVERRVTEHSVGLTSAGIPYQGFNYTSSVYDEYAGVATLRLSRCLPPFFVSLPDNPRAGIAGVEIPNQVGLLVVAADAAYGQAVLDGSLMAIREFARHRALDLAIDGDSLTAVQVPLGAQALRDYCEDMAMVATTISGNEALRRFEIPREPGQGFFGFPGAVYVERDDRLLAVGPATKGGDNHRATGVIAMPPDQGLQAVAFTHSYDTTTYDGTTTTTQTQSEHIVYVRLSFAFGRLALDWRGVGKPFMMFAPEFEKKHQWYADDPASAGDVLRPMLGWIAQLDPPAFAVQDYGMWFQLTTPPTPQLAQWCETFAYEFFERVPVQVWQRLGHPSNPLTLDLR